MPAVMSGGAQSAETPCGAAVISRAPHVLAANTASGYVLASPIDGWVADLNATGSEIWRLIERPIGVDALHDHLERSFAAPRAQLERDVAAFIAHLRSMAMIVVTTV